MMLAALMLLSAKPIDLLFVGNSLLNYNDVPEMVVHLLQTDGVPRKVNYKKFFVGHLEDVPDGGEIDGEILSGKYEVVVLQAAMVSSSLSRTYDQSKGIAMAKAAKAKGARVLLYVEWPRRGIDETNYTMNVYRGIANAADSELVPVCYAWNSVLAKAPDAPLWSADGNHAQVPGSFLAACCVYFHVAGTDRTPTWKPDRVDAGLASLCLSEARMLEKRVLAKRGKV